jgi:hypothetical protein
VVGNSKTGFPELVFENQVVLERPECRTPAPKNQLLVERSGRTVLEKVT